MKAKTSAHPPRETLAAFGSGELQPDEAVAVERHIEQCEECCETLNGLGSDTFIDLVRRSDAVQLDSFESDGTVGLQDATTETVGDLPDELAKHPRYRILKLLGKGGMGDVYKAEHTLMNRTVAVKVINHQLVQNPLAVQRFRREVQSAARLAHSNIVTAYDAEQAGDVHLLVMEYVAGDTWCDVVKRDGPLEIPLACGFIQQASQGLQPSAPSIVAGSSAVAAHGSGRGFIGVWLRDATTVYPSLVPRMGTLLALTAHRGSSGVACRGFAAPIRGRTS